MNRDLRAMTPVGRAAMPPAEQRTGRRERVVLGTYLLACYMAAISMVVNVAFTGVRRAVGPEPALARQISIVAGLTLLATVVLAVRYFGSGPGIKLILREAWPGLLAGSALALITGAPMRAFVPANVFWLALAAVYVAGLLIIRWFARRAPPGT